MDFEKSKDMDFEATGRISYNWHAGTPRMDRNEAAMASPPYHQLIHVLGSCTLKTDSSVGLVHAEDQLKHWACVRNQCPCSLA